MATEEVTRLVEEAKRYKDDPQSPQYKRAIEGLREWNASHAKKANQYMRNLERADIRRYAYSRAINFTQNYYGTNSFKTGKALSISDADLIDQVLEIDTYLGRKTATATGAKAFERSRGEYLANNFDINVKSIARRLGMPTKSAETAFYRFLGTDTVASFLKDVSGYYKVVLEGTATVIASSADKRSTVDRLTRAIEDYLAGAKRYDTLLAELGVDINDLSDTAKIY